MKCVLFLLIGLLSCFMLFAQSNDEIKKLEGIRKALQEQIRQSETLLTSTNKDVGSQLSSLSLLTSQIVERKRYILTIEKDIAVLNKEITSLQQQLKQLQSELEDRKDKYASSVRYMYNNRSIEEKLMFIFSARTLSQTYRRMRYMQEYTDFQRRQAEEIIAKQTAIRDKQQELEQTRKSKARLLTDGQQERRKLEQQEKEKKSLLSTLQKRQKDLQNEISKQRKEADKLNAQIDKLIEAEIAAAKKRAEEEAKREAALAAKKEEEAKAKPATTTPPPSSTSPTPAAPEKKESSSAVYTMDKADRQLSGDFEKNRGLLPMPITGPHIIVSHYGQYAVEGLRNVKLDNKGIDIQGKDGAMARAVFNGEVSAIFQYNNGLIGVLVRHGNYISVYCNLSEATVKKGDKVKTKDVIGKIHANNGRPLLHFQLRKETTKLNPEMWLDK